MKRKEVNDTRPTKKGRSSYHLSILSPVTNSDVTVNKKERAVGSEGGKDRVSGTKEKKVPNRDNRARSPWNKITNLTLLHLLP